MNHKMTWFGVGIGLAVMVALPLAGPFGGLRWHDQQRIGQIAVFLVVTLGVIGFLVRKPALLCPIGRLERGGLLAILVLGLWSAWRARYPVWALAEISLFVMSLALGWIVAQLRARTLGATLDGCLGFALLFLCLAFSAQFLVSYVSLITSDLARLDSRAMLHGFSNVRFYGQFQTLTLPLIVWPMLDDRVSRGKRVGLLVLGILWWTQTFFGGSRGVWLGLFAACIAMSVIGRLGRRWAAWQVLMAAAGLVCYWVLATVIPLWLNMPVRRHITTRLTFKLSGRAELWSRAVDLAIGHPLLGVGPMHFADVTTPISAHPHQAVLQWASEWGLPATLLVLMLLLWGGFRARGVLRLQPDSTVSEAPLRVCLAAAVFASTVLAMVDGVIVMPYTQLWLAILAGWLVGVCAAIPQSGLSLPSWRWIWGITVISATGMLLFVIVRDAPTRQHHIESYTHEHGSVSLHPRFWIQGVITERPVRVQMFERTGENR